MWAAHTDSDLEADSLHVAGKALDLTIAQPQDPKHPAVETVLTKTDRMLPGLRLRPLLHPVSDQWEAPFFYSDEHGTLVVTGSESVVEWVKIVHYYSPVVVGPAASDVHIPPI